MATIHKFVDDGAEAYLPFLLAREREIRRRKKKERERGQGQAIVTLVEDEPMEGSYTANFDFGDGIEGELRMVSNQSFIRLTKGGSAGSGWVAYPFSISMQYSAANNWPKLSFVSPMPENPGPAPTLPYIQPPNPDGGYSIIHSRSDCAPGLNNYFDVYLFDQTAPSTLAYNLRQAAIRDHLYFTAAESRLYVNNPSDAYLACPIGPDFSVSWVYEGEYQGQNVYHGEYSWNGQVTNESRRIDKAIEIAGIFKAHYEAEAAASAAWQIAYAAWLVKFNRWNEAVSGTPPDPTVCYQHQDNVRSAMMQSRPTQISALQAEVLLGMRALPVFNGAARPQYVPLERPADTFTKSAGGDSVRVWRSPDFYELEVSSISPGGSDPRMCGSTLSTKRLSNVYIDASPSDDRRWGTTKRAFGFSVSGDVNPDFWMGAPPDERNVKLAATYPAWLKSRKTKYFTSEEQRNLDYDLTVGRSGRIRLLCFEFRVYDPASEVWVWTPSPRIIETPAAMSCVTGYCLSANRTPPVTPLQTPPSSPVYRVSDMRVLTAFEQAYAPGDDEGTTEWGKPEALSLYNAQFTISLDGLPFDKYELPTGVAVMYGVDPTALPAEPSLRSATTMAHMANDQPVQPPGSAMDVQSLTEWLVKEGTNALLTAQLAPPTP